jgi:hypothetical protein
MTSSSASRAYVSAGPAHTIAPVGQFLSRATRRRPRTQHVDVGRLETRQQPLGVEPQTEHGDDLRACGSVARPDTGGRLTHSVLVAVRRPRHSHVHHETQRKPCPRDRAVRQGASRRPPKCETDGTARHLVCLRQTRGAGRRPRPRARAGGTRPAHTAPPALSGPRRSRSQSAPAPAADPSRGRSTPQGSRRRGQAPAAGRRTRVREDGQRRTEVPSVLTGSGWRGARPSVAAPRGPPYPPEPSWRPARGAAFVRSLVRQRGPEAKTATRTTAHLLRAHAFGVRALCAVLAELGQPVGAVEDAGHAHQQRLEGLGVDLSSTRGNRENAAIRADVERMHARAWAAQRRASFQSNDSSMCRKAAKALGTGLGISPRITVLRGAVSRRRDAGRTCAPQEQQRDGV